MGQAASRTLYDYAGRGNGLIWGLVLWFIVFITWGLGWYVLFTNVIPPGVILSLQNALVLITFIFSPVYYKWLSNQWDGYNDGPRLYKSLFNQLESLSELVMLSLASPECMLSPYLDASSNQVQLPRQAQLYTLRQTASRLFALLDALAYFTTRLFILQDEGAYAGTLVFDEMTKKYDKQISVFGDILPSNAAMDPTTYILRNIRYEILREIDTLPRVKYGRIYDALAQIRTVQLDMSGTPIVDPPFQEHYTNFLIFVYFAICFPFSCYTAAGDSIIWAYPVFVMLFTGYYWIRHWLMSPFDARNPMGLDHFFQIRSETRRNMFLVFQRLSIQLMS